ncbi:hypothetical protein [Rouxiella aceris]|nr:hypothetical protein [Rouxiella aceris]
MRLAVETVRCSHTAAVRCRTRVHLLTGMSVSVGTPGFIYAVAGRK